MHEDQDTSALKAQQDAEVEHQRRLAREASEEEAVAQHTRRADKAEYLREKLEERERSEHEAAED